MNIDDPRITAYALGEDLDDDERAQVESLQSADPATAAAIREIARTAAALAGALAGEAATDPEARLSHEQRQIILTRARASRGPGYFRRLAMNPRIRVAASLVVLAALAAYFFPARHGPSAMATGTILVPDGGRLDALDEVGRLLGPCPLEHTAVAAEVSGHFSRVNVTQRYSNPYQRKIEAVYTFPLSHRGAVDRMTMTVGDRVIEGEVKERQAARQIYEAARSAGHVASLLEQERPNIFTQSVANIEPGATVLVEISYVEVLQSADGLHTFEFPMVVGPRYIPGAPTATGAVVPAELVEREGVILLGPAQLTVGAAGDLSKLGALQPGKLEALLTTARPIEYPGDLWWGAGDASGGAGQPVLWHRFEAAYADGSKEPGELYTDGTGWVGGRWFYTDPAVAAGMGSGFESDTNQVPDASRITPMPVRPPTRAGHDVSVSVSIDTGGPAIRDVSAPLHEITRREDGPSRMTVSLAAAGEIPNRDFVLSWRTSDDSIQEAVLAHAGEAKGGFFTLILQPPTRVDPTAIPARELVFVMDVSGSMEGFPIEKSKAVMTRAIDAMRPADTFNVITFSGHTAVLWSTPQPATAQNRAEARRFVESQSGGGGTEMMQAIDTALVQRGPGGDDGGLPMRIVFFLTDGYIGNDMAIIGAIRDNARTTRVFPFGIGDSVNRYLIDGMAAAGRGEAEFVLLESDADAAVQRLARRIQTPVLTDITVEFGAGLAVSDLLPEPGLFPDLFDQKPLVIQGRYAEPGRGTVTIRGRTGAGPWQRTIDLDLPAREPGHDVLATLWARAKVESIMNRDLAAAQQGAFPPGLQKEIVALGEQFSILTRFTSFVAVERSRITLGGAPVHVAVPVELPQGVSWEGIFGEAMQKAAALAAPMADREAAFFELGGGDVTEVLRIGVSGVSDQAGNLGQPAAADTRMRFGVEVVQEPHVFGDINGLAMQSPWQQEQPSTSPAIELLAGILPHSRSGQSIYYSYNMAGPTDGKQTFGLMTYPDDWANLSLKASGATGLPPTTSPPAAAPGPVTPVNLVTRFVAPQAWSVNGGDLLSINQTEGAYVIQPMQDTAQSRAVAREASRFLYDLTALCPPEQRYQIQIDGLPVDPERVPVIVPPPPPAPATEFLDVADLVGAAGPESGPELAAAIRALIEPTSWAAGGSSIEFFAGRLIVKAPAPTHAAIADLLASLRAALGLTAAPPDGARPADDGTATLRAYDLRRMVALGDAAGGSRRATLAALGNVIGGLVGPGSDGHIAPFGGAILVRAAPPGHEAVSRFLKDLSASLGLDGDDAAVASILRVQRLKRVLDVRLLPFATAEGSPETLVALYDGPTPQDTDWSDGGVLLSVRVEPLDDAAVEAMSALGILVQARVASGSFVVAAVPLGRIDELAMLDAVRWVEPARVSR